MTITPIETTRLHLRPLIGDDLDIIFTIFSQDTLMKPYGMHAVKTKDQAKKLLDAMTPYEWAITLPNTKAVIGTIGFVDWQDKNKRAELAFELLEPYWHQGYAKEAVLAVINTVFTTTDMNRLEAFVYPSNKASIAVLEKTGFIKEGLLRERAIKHDAFQDYYLYALLKSDYQTPIE